MSLGLSLTQAEEKTGVVAVRIGSYERGDRQPGIDVLARIAEGYGCTVSTFLPDVAAEPTPLVAERIASELTELRRQLAALTSLTHELLSRAGLLSEAA